MAASNSPSVIKGDNWLMDGFEFGYYCLHCFDPIGLDGAMRYAFDICLYPPSQPSGTCSQPHEATYDRRSLEQFHPDLQKSLRSKSSAVIPAKAGIQQQAP